MWFFMDYKELDKKLKILKNRVYKAYSRFTDFSLIVLLVLNGFVGSMVLCLIFLFFKSALKQGLFELYGMKE